MDTGSPAFLTRKVAPLARSPPSFARLNRLYPAPQIEILEKELADANARLALIDADVRPRPPPASHRRSPPANPRLPCRAQASAAPPPPSGDGGRPRGIARPGGRGGGEPPAPLPGASPGERSLASLSRVAAPLAAVQGGRCINLHAHTAPPSAPMAERYPRKGHAARP